MWLESVYNKTFDFYVYKGNACFINFLDKWSYGTGILLCIINIILTTQYVLKQQPLILSRDVFQGQYECDCTIILVESKIKYFYIKAN